jgi:small subunit ribosomal protein S16
MITIRLARSGANKRPFYHIVVADKRNARDGRFVEQLGYFNPIAAGKDKRLTLDMERISYWQQCGAEVSARVKKLLKEFTVENNEAIA